MMPLSLSINPRAISAFSPDTDSSLHGRMCDASCIAWDSTAQCHSGVKELINREREGLTLANVMNSW